MKNNHNSKSSKKKEILCFNEYYLPGQKSGGPVRTLVNFVEYLGDDYKIKIISSDRDYLDKKPYSNKDLNKWHKVGKAKVFYMSKKNINFKSIKEILSNTSYDLLYLNGLFSYEFTILPLIVRMVRKELCNIPCAIAPRGMLSKNATKLKSSKKRLFLLVANFLGLYKNLVFQASNESEKIDISRNLKLIKSSIFVAPNLTIVKPISISKINVKKKSPLKLVFLSRISPMKNLDFLLRALSKVNTPIDFAIYGNKEDESYYRKCFDLKDQLPKNIRASFKSHIKNELVQKVLINYDLFVLPTRGENFGHVILESLSAGVPVLVSNKVFWRSDKAGGIQKLSLEENIWTSAITKWSNYSNEKLAKKKIAALNAAYKYNIQNNALQMNKNLLEFTLKINNDR